MKGLTIWFSTSVPYSLSPDFKLLAEKKKKKTNFDFESKSYCPGKQIDKILSFCGGGGGAGKLTSLPLVLAKNHARKEKQLKGQVCWKV